MALFRLSASLSQAAFLAVAAAALAQDDRGLRPFTVDEQARIQALVLEAESVRTMAQTERVRVISIAPVEADKDAGAPPGGRPLAEVVLVSYRSNKSLRLRVDPTGGRVVSTEPLPGRPQASAAEREEGEKALRADETVGRLLQEGNRVVGGFVVDPPEAGRPGRYLEYHVADPGGRKILREVIVDLATNRVAASREYPEGGR